MSLTPERRRQIEQVYRAALELEAGRRHAFLESSAGDEELRRELEAMLAQGGGFASSESTGGKRLYFTRDLASESSLWKKPVGGGEEVQVLPSVTYANFAVVNDGIYLTKTAQGPATRVSQFLPAGRARWSLRSVRAMWDSACHQTGNGYYLPRTTRREANWFWWRDSDE
jgi:hypothetical protein